jgi:hypothetical protein
MTRRVRRGERLVTSDLMSAKLRLVHSVEIGADSFAYTGILVAVLAARPRAYQRLQPSATGAMMSRHG